MSSLFCVTRERNRFLQRGQLADGIENGGCKTCYLGNKQKEKTSRLYIRGLKGGKRELLEFRVNLRSKGKIQHCGSVQTVSDTKDNLTER